MNTDDVRGDIILMLLDRDLWFQQDQAIAKLEELKKTASVKNVVNGLVVSGILQNAHDLRNSAVNMVHMMMEGQMKQIFEDCDKGHTRYTDPITQDLIVNPVTLSDSEQIYEKKSLMQHLARSALDPMSGKRLEDRTMIDASYLTSLIQKFVDETYKHSKKMLSEVLTFLENIKVSVIFVNHYPLKLPLIQETEKFTTLVSQVYKLIDTNRKHFKNRPGTAPDVNYNLNLFLERLYMIQADVEKLFDTRKEIGAYFLKIGDEKSYVEIIQKKCLQAGIVKSRYEVLSLLQQMFVYYEKNAERVGVKKPLLTTTKEIVLTKEEQDGVNVLCNIVTHFRLELERREEEEDEESEEENFEDLIRKKPLGTPHLIEKAIEMLKKGMKFYPSRRIEFLKQLPYFYDKEKNNDACGDIFYEIAKYYFEVENESEEEGEKKMSNSETVLKYLNLSLKFNDKNVKTLELRYKFLERENERKRKEGKVLDMDILQTAKYGLELAECSGISEVDRIKLYEKTLKMLEKPKDNLARIVLVSPFKKRKILFEKKKKKKDEEEEEEEEEDDEEDEEEEDEEEIAGRNLAQINEFKNDVQNKLISLWTKSGELNKVLKHVMKEQREKRKQRKRKRKYKKLQQKMDRKQKEKKSEKEEEEDPYLTPPESESESEEDEEEGNEAIMFVVRLMMDTRKKQMELERRVEALESGKKTSSSSSSYSRSWRKKTTETKEEKKDEIKYYSSYDRKKPENQSQQQPTVEPSKEKKEEEKEEEERKVQVIVKIEPHDPESEKVPKEEEEPPKEEKKEEKYFSSYDRQKSKESEKESKKESEKEKNEYAEYSTQEKYRGEEKKKEKEEKEEGPPKEKEKEKDKFSRGEYFTYENFGKSSDRDRDRNRDRGGSRRDRDRDRDRDRRREGRYEDRDRGYDKYRSVRSSRDSRSSKDARRSSRDDGRGSRDRNERRGGRRERRSRLTSEERDRERKDRENEERKRQKEVREAEIIAAREEQLREQERERERERKREREGDDEFVSRKKSIRKREERRRRREKEEEEDMGYERKSKSRKGKKRGKDFYGESPDKDPDEDEELVTRGRKKKGRRGKYVSDEDEEERSSRRRRRGGREKEEVDFGRKGRMRDKREREKERESQRRKDDFLAQVKEEEEMENEREKSLPKTLAGLDGVVEVDVKNPQNFGVDQYYKLSKNFVMHNLSFRLRVVLELNSTVSCFLELESRSRKVYGRLLMEFNGKVKEMMRMPAKRTPRSSSEERRESVEPGEEQLAAILNNEDRRKEHSLNEKTNEKDGWVHGVKSEDNGFKEAFDYSEKDHWKFKLMLILHKIVDFGLPPGGRVVFGATGKRDPPVPKERSILDQSDDELLRDDHDSLDEDYF